MDAALDPLDVPSAVELLLEHLLENAGRHTPSGTQVRVLLDGDGPAGATLVVEDDGPGLPDRDDLFEPFVTVGAGGGSGLGLHIVSELAGQLDGTVETGASASGGARFRVHVPTSRVGAATPTREVDPG